MLTIDKVIESNKIILKNFPSSNKKHTHKVEFTGLFSEIGKKLKKEKKTSADLVREIREGQ